MLNFSLIHPSARPSAWQAIYRDWLSKAASPELTEYILVCCRKMGFAELPVMDRPQDRAVWAEGNETYVENCNLGAKWAAGEALICIADDQFAADFWDVYLYEKTELGEAIRHYAPLAVAVNTGTPSEFDRHMLHMPIITSALYDKWGEIFHAAYESMYSDVDAFERAEHDGVLRIYRDSPMFPHRHAMWDTSVKWDAAYAKQNRPEAYRIGKALLDQRRANGFKPVVTPQPREFDRKPRIVVCLPGETFSARWVKQWTELDRALCSKFECIPLFAESSNVYVTRAGLWEECKKIAPDFVLWIDDDNLVTVQDAANLMEVLNQVPGADAACGWCWMSKEGRLEVSAGKFADNWTLKSVDYRAMMQFDSPIFQVDWTGFPVVLMRASIFEKAGERPFTPQMYPNHPLGFGGEDTSFCKALKERRPDALIVLDRRVKVPHLKLGPMQDPLDFARYQQPNLPTEVPLGAAAVEAVAN